MIWAERRSDPLIDSPSVLLRFDMVSRNESPWDLGLSRRIVRRVQMDSDRQIEAGKILGGIRP